MSEIKNLLRSAKEKLAAADISEIDAEHLFAYVLGISRMDLHNSVKLDATLKSLGDFGVIEDTFAKLLSRRAAHEPLQYLTGTAYFRHLEIEVGPGVLVPRPESELLVEAVLTHVKNFLKIFEKYLRSFLLNSASLKPSFTKFLAFSD